MEAAASDARNISDSATSDGGMKPGITEVLLATRSQFASAGSPAAAASIIGVAMPPGETQLTRTPRVPNSTASERMPRSRAAFEAQYCAL